jgi:DNA polymerase-3 subunit chi
MLKLTFYILNSTEEKTRWFFCCKLIEKIYRQGHYCYVFTGSENQSRLLDTLLWTFRSNSFIPHALYSNGLPNKSHKVLIGSNLPPEGWQKIMINFSHHPLDSPNKTERLLEIVDYHPERRHQGRQRYRHYQQQRFMIQTITL